MHLKYYLILARCENNGIGYKGSLPWSLKNELSYFMRMTKDVSNPEKKNAVIMGRKTWEALPQNKTPLPGRLNIVLSSKNMNVKGAFHCKSFEEAEKLLQSSDYKNTIETAWVIGGSQVYESAIKENYCDRVYLTNIMKKFPCDTFVNLDLKNFQTVKDPRVPSEVQEENGIKYQFEVYEKLPVTPN